MKHDLTRQVIALSDYRAFAEPEVTTGSTRIRQEEKQKEVFFETLYELLMKERHTVLSFIGMKLDARRRKCFSEELERCRDSRDECRCVKTYLRHLPIKDVNALLIGVRRMLTGKMDVVACPGEEKPDRRLAKFARRFGLSEADVNEWIMLFLLAS